MSQPASQQEPIVVVAPRQCAHCNTRTHLYTPAAGRKGGWWRVTCTGCGRYYGYWQGGNPKANVASSVPMTNDL